MGQHATGFIPPSKQQVSVLSQGLVSFYGNAYDSYSASEPYVVGDPDEARFDPRDEGYLTPVKNQGQCGSCWDFAAMVAFETSYSIRNHAKINASEQQVLDCSGAGNCIEGGHPYMVFQWMAEQRHAVTDELAYSYLNRKADCQSADGKYRALNWGRVGSDHWSSQLPTVASIKKAICQHGAVICSVIVDDAFDGYSGGVFAGNACCTTNHAVVLMGWDDAKGAWLLRNS